MTFSSNNKAKIILLIILFVFGISIVSIFKILPGSSNSYLIWLSIVIHILIISRILWGIFPGKELIIRKVALLLFFFSLYFTLGTLVIQYSGEGKYESNLLNFIIGSEIEYSLDMKNGLGVPVKIDGIFPIGQKNLKYLKISEIHQRRNSLNLKMKFAIIKEQASYPTYVILIYRVYGIIPLINIMELNWHNF